MKNRRGVSQIIGSLIVLALVASVGSVILFQGLNQINAFNYDLSFHDRENNEALREDIAWEHVRFVPNSNQIEVYVANVGSIDSTIVTATVVKVDTQELVVSWQDIPETDGKLFLDDNTVITLNADLGSVTQWNSTGYNGTTQYAISLTTDKGNLIKTVRSPGEDFNS
jgi:hypothetical protein